MTIRIHKNYLKQELLTPSVLITGVVTAMVYILFSTLMMNSKLIMETLSGSYPFTSKVSIIIELIKGVRLLYNPMELSLLFVLGFLMGINLILIVKSLQDRRRKMGSWSLGLGMAGVIATTGCASCGITLLSVAGPTVSAGLLPFQGIGIQIVCFVLLLVSLVHTMNRRNSACVIVRS